MIDGLKSGLPFSGRKGKTFSPGLAQNNESYESTSMK